MPSSSHVPILNGSSHNDPLYESLKLATSALESGDSKDVFNCDLTSMNLSLRVRSDKDHKWTEWIPINHQISGASLVQTFVPELSKEKCDERTPLGTFIDISIFVL
jgi:hypothetical protein